MLTMGIDIASRSAKCVILEDGQLLTYGQVEAGPDSTKTAYLAVDAAIHRRSALWGGIRMPMIAGAVGAALFALDRAKNKA